MSETPQPPKPQPAPIEKPPRKGGGILARLATGVITSVLLISIVLNVYLGLIVQSMTGGPSEMRYLKGDTERRIVIIPIDGAIGDETAVFVRRALQSLREASTLPKAIVLRVDSPGGGVSASDRIWYELTKFKEETQIPMVVSFGSVAASGGYYVAMAGDYIVCEPTTITGSIGVIAQAFTLEQLLDKVGVTPEIIVATGSNKKDVLSPFRNWGDEDRAALKVLLDESYERFVEVVEKGRSQVLSHDEVLAVATGEVLTAQQALDKKLVDEHGYLDAAIAKAQSLAGIPADVQPYVTIMQPPSGLGEIIGMHTNVISPLGSLTSEKIREYAADLATPQMEYRMRPLSR